MFRASVIFLFLLLSTPVFNQDFTANYNGIKPFLILQFPGFDKSTLFQKACYWANEHYNSYNKTNLHSIRNDKIRTTVRIGKLHFINVELTFKKEKVKFEIIRYFRVTNYCSDGEFFVEEIDNSLKGIANNEYSPSTGQIRKLLHLHKKYCVTFNALKNNFYNYCLTSFEERESSW